MFYGQVLYLLFQFVEKLAFQTLQEPYSIVFNETVKEVYIGHRLNVECQSIITEDTSSKVERIEFVLPNGQKTEPLLSLPCKKLSPDENFRKRHPGGVITTLTNCPMCTEFSLNLIIPNVSELYNGNLTCTVHLENGKEYSGSMVIKVHQKPTAVCKKMEGNICECSLNGSFMAYPIRFEGAGRPFGCDVKNETIKINTNEVVQICAVEMVLAEVYYFEVTYRNESMIEKKEFLDFCYHDDAENNLLMLAKGDNRQDFIIDTNQESTFFRYFPVTRDLDSFSWLICLILSMFLIAGANLFLVWWPDLKSCCLWIRCRCSGLSQKHDMDVVASENLIQGEISKLKGKRSLKPLKFKTTQKSNKKGKQESPV